MDDLQCRTLEMGREPHTGQGWGLVQTLLPQGSDRDPGGHLDLDHGLEGSDHEHGEHWGLDHGVLRMKGWGRDGEGSDREQIVYLQDWDGACYESLDSGRIVVVCWQGLDRGLTGKALG